MSIDISGTLAAIDGMSEAALDRLMVNVSSWLASGDPRKVEAARKVKEAVIQTSPPAVVTDYEATSESERCELLKRAFRRRPLTETETKVICVLLANPGETSSALSARIGWEGQAWHAHFGALCHAREDLLWRADRSEVRDAPFYSSVLAEFDAENATFRARPEIVKCLAELSGCRLPGE